MSYKIASIKKQASLRRVTPKQLGDFQIEATEKESVENLKLMARNLQAKLHECNLRGLGKTNPERLSLVGQMTSVQDQLTKLNARKKYTRNWQQFLFDVIRAEVSKPQWEIWCTKATKAEEEFKKKNETHSPDDQTRVQK